jgi:FkbM family methyltransferase
MPILVNHLRSKIIALVAPAIRIFPPWWKVRIYMHLAGNPFHQGGYFGKVKNRKLYPHRYPMELSLDDWMERFAFFVGCYYEIDATATVLSLLRRGDCFIDVGANLGFLTLTASRVVGPEGKVLAFEPNKAVADRLSHTLFANRINNVFVHKYALGDEEGEATLDSSAHSGTGSLRHNGTSGTKVDVLCGDSFISELPEDAWVLVKLDVEGYELRVLKGFQSLIKRPKTGFLVEVTDKWLRTTGGSADELFDLMLGNGFKAYLPKLTFYSKFELHLIKRPVADRHQYDVVFLRSEDSWHVRAS